MNPWLLYAFLTVLSWGVYGVLLGMGRQGMLSSPAGQADMHNAGLKAFLIVGVAYFVVAIVGPIIMLKKVNSNWSFTGSGISWSFVAGAAGAIGAFTLILALGAGSLIYKGAVSAAVMPIVFGGAPIVNSIVVILKTRGFDGFKTLPFPFAVGVILAALGGILVALYTPLPPTPAPAGAPPAAAETKAAEPKATEPKAAEPKPAESKPAAPVPTFPAVPAEPEHKPTDTAKPTEPKPAEVKPSDSSSPPPAEPKPSGI
jgi:hypothetical protein